MHADENNVFPTEIKKPAQIIITKLNPIYIQLISYKIS
jgi:hypothetical protein